MSQPATERHKIAWWLEQTTTGPATLNTPTCCTNTIREIARILREEPERFSDGPT